MSLLLIRLKLLRLFVRFNLNAFFNIMLPIALFKKILWNDNQMSFIENQMSLIEMLCWIQQRRGAVFQFLFLVKAFHQDDISWCTREFGCDAKTLLIFGKITENVFPVTFSQPSCHIRLWSCRGSYSPVCCKVQSLWVEHQSKHVFTHMLHIQQLALYRVNALWYWYLTWRGMIVLW